MSDLQEDHEFNCPYCGELNAFGIDASGGRRQTFVTDCETCCRPMEIEMEIEDDGYVNVIVKREGEG